MSAPPADRPIRSPRFTESVDWAAGLRGVADHLRVHHCEPVVLWEEKEKFW